MGSGFQARFSPLEQLNCSQCANSGSYSQCGEGQEQVGHHILNGVQGKEQMSEEERIDEDSGIGGATSQPDEAHDDEPNNGKGKLKPQERPEHQRAIGLIGQAKVEEVDPQSLGGDMAPKTIPCPHICGTKWGSGAAQRVIDERGQPQNQTSPQHQEHPPLAQDAGPYGQDVKAIGRGSDQGNGVMSGSQPQSHGESGQPAIMSSAPPSDQKPQVSGGQRGANNMCVGMDGMLPEIGGDSERNSGEEGRKKRTPNCGSGIGEQRLEIAHDQVDHCRYPGPDRRRQKIGAEGDSANRDKGLPELSQQSIEGIAWRMSDAQDGRNKLILGRIAKEGAWSSRGGVKGKDGSEEKARDENTNHTTGTYPCLSR